MGSPISGTLANIFLCFHEQQWINNCPLDFKPVIYKRYVDDTFLLFRDPSHAPRFLEYINKQHNNIRFTMEEENEGKLPFLDLMIEILHNKFTLSVYRKPTFSGLGTSFFSYCDLKFKLGAIRTLLHRAYHLSSTYMTFDKEITFLKNFFIKNGFTKQLFEKQVNKLLTNIYQPKTPVHTAKKKEIYIKLPFLGETSFKIEKALNHYLTNYYPQITFRFVHSNSFKIG